MTIKLPEIRRFLCSLERIEDSEIVLAGFPYDATASFRAGARFAPRQLRANTHEVLEYFSFQLGESLDTVPYFDAGDMELTFGDPALMVAQYRSAALELINSGRRLVGIGGDHLIHYPLYIAAKERFDDFAVLQLDAHADLLDEFLGARLSHATVMKKCLDAGLKKLIQFGVRSGCQYEYTLRQRDERILPAATIDDIMDALLPNENLYITLDVDFFDPAFVPGTGTPDAGGATYDDFIQILKALKAKNIRVIGADITELAPEIDPTGNSTQFVGKVLRELLICMK